MTKKKSSTKKAKPSATRPSLRVRGASISQLAHSTERHLNALATSELGSDRTRALDMARQLLVFAAHADGNTRSPLIESMYDALIGERGARFAYIVETLDRMKADRDVATAMDATHHDGDEPPANGFSTHHAASWLLDLVREAAARRPRPAGVARFLTGTDKEMELAEQVVRGWSGRGGKRVKGKQALGKWDLLAALLRHFDYTWNTSRGDDGKALEDEVRRFRKSGSKATLRTKPKPD